MSLDYAKYRLTEWGRWSRDPPALRSNWRLWFSGNRETDHMPTHIEEVNAIINRMERRLRVLIVIHYCRHGTDLEKSRMAEMRLHAYRLGLDEGTWFVHTELDSIDCQGQYPKNGQLPSRRIGEVLP